MKDKSFKEFYDMISNAVDVVTYNGHMETNSTIIECATKMYIEQMRIRAYGPTAYSEQYDAMEVPDE